MHDFKEITEYEYHYPNNIRDDISTFQSYKKFYICRTCKTKTRIYGHNIYTDYKFLGHDELTCDEILIKRIIE